MNGPPVDALDVDVAVIGSGFAGSLAALVLRTQRRRVALIERGRHPRFAIGESTTPLTNLLLEELADRYGLPQIRPFSKWGTWKRARPDVAVGLKRGFTFLFHNLGERFVDDEHRSRQLLVAASPHNEIADTHWYRPDFDLALVTDAQAAGAIYLDNTRLDEASETPTHVRLRGSRNGRAVDITAGFVIDASGPRGFMARALGSGSEPLRWLPPTQGLYTHFEQVALWAGDAPRGPVPPYPPDAAALHHVFPGGWIWVLRFNNGITSAGAALTDALATRIGAAEGQAAWDRLLALLPSVADQFRGARATMPFVHVPRLAFRSGQIVGRRWALLPSAAGVIDPLLSTGFPLTLLGLLRLLALLESGSEGRPREAALADYAQTTRDELDVTEQLVAALYASMTDTGLFKRLTLLYFAAASYTEAARRLARPHLAPGFLLNQHPEFGAELRACAAIAAARPDATERAALLDRIDAAITPFDIAGLRDRTRRDWYPALASDLLAGASKLEATPRELQRLLEQSGFSPA
ncbi:MAG: FAD-dependent oxidoreductase [Vicinamibacterales bacterium]